MHPIAKAGKKAGMTLEKLAKKIGVNRSFLSQITTHRSALPMRTAHAIAEVTGVNAGRLHYQSTYEMMLKKYKKEKAGVSIELIEEIVSFMAWGKMLEAMSQYIAETGDLHNLDETKKEIRKLVKLSALTGVIGMIQNDVIEENPNISVEEMENSSASVLKAFGSSCSGKLTDILERDIETKQSILSYRQKKKA